MGNLFFLVIQQYVNRLYLWKEYNTHKMSKLVHSLASYHDDMVFTTHVYKTHQQNSGRARPYLIQF